MNTIAYGLLAYIFLIREARMTLFIRYNCTLWLLSILLLGNFACSTTRLSTREQKSAQVKSTRIKARVVLDPGHGGSDSGAISKRGLMEKNITLDIAKRLKNLIERNLPEVEVVLTRSSDAYVSLEERIRIAHRKPGHLFLSLHVNSSESKKASGFEIYSLDVAGDRHAERLAARENKVENKNGRGVNFILADLRAFSNRKDSDKLAKSVALGLKAQLKKTKAASAISDRGYNQAIFHVLFVKMPAVLAELFFISNPQEEKMLSEQIYREAIARGLFLGVRNFLATNANKNLRADNAK